MTIFAALFIFVGLPSIGFEGMLYPFVTLFGIPCVYGLTIGHCFSALWHGFGPIDFITPILMFPMKFLMLKQGYKRYPFHAVALGIWIPFIQYLIGRYPIAGLHFLTLSQIAGELFWQGMGVYLIIKVGMRYRMC